MAVTLRHEVGPVYGVKLIDSLPLGGMFQKMPDRQELQQVRKKHERVVAAYEVLLSRRQMYREFLQAAVEEASQCDNDSVKCELALRRLAVTAQELLTKLG